MQEGTGIRRWRVFRVAKSERKNVSNKKEEKKDKTKNKKQLIIHKDKVNV